MRGVDSRFDLAAGALVRSKERVARRRFKALVGGAIIVLWTSASADEPRQDPQIGLSAYASAASGAGTLLGEASADAALKQFRQYAFQPMTAAAAATEMTDGDCAEHPAQVSVLRLSRRHMDFALPLGSGQLRRWPGHQLAASRDHIRRLQELAASARHAKAEGLRCAEPITHSATVLASFAAHHAVARRLASKTAQHGHPPVRNLTSLQRMFDLMSHAKAPGAPDLQAVAGKIARAASLR